ncbi:hypothetical protein H1O16_gp015 [Burkholderia phage BcepSaruman]|uniref:Uncharacterized protein n=1 Tax=Burkholderia phage BcepSaruman TaxID=2530032 RepID=A0A4D5ZH99_9CAUD|nr:hypothetical protein H1O16_gp015 [Burkholderia phage BcepSaruman]QBX06428.1 hypothetical protein BcepSaruman_015 [Burkholderia phage BcepSaruman]
MQVRARDVQAGDTLKIDGARGLVLFVYDANGIVTFDLEFEGRVSSTRSYRSGQYVERV